MARIPLDEELELIAPIIGGKRNVELLRADIRALYLANRGLDERTEEVDSNVTHKVLAVMAREPVKYRIESKYRNGINKWSDYQPILAVSPTK